jgi:DUF4097 and DUF4098 domain-containing protein YvlB
MPSSSHVTPAPVDLEVRNPAGSVDITAADTEKSTVEVIPERDSADARDLADRTRVALSADGRRLTVIVPEKRVLFGRATRIAVSVTVPLGSTVRARTASADVRCRGQLDAAEVNTASGDVVLDQVAGDVEVYTASGSVDVRAGGRVTAHSASGSIRVGRAGGDVEAHTASGRVRIGTAEGSVRAQTASGDITVEEASQGAVKLNAASGDLHVGVRAGAVARLDLSSLSGRVRSDLPVEDVAPQDGHTIDIQAQTLSGSVLVTRAAPTPAA